MSRVRHLAPRHAVTLIELLITITIIATLSAAFLGASRSAMEAANAARTKSTVNKIHGLLMEKWSSFSTRRADINPLIIIDIKRAFPNNPTYQGKALADARLLATRELMKLEMPDRWSDVVLEVIPDTTVGTVNLNRTSILAARPNLSRNYLQRFTQAVNVNNNGKTLKQNQGAECLYLTIMLATADGEARSLFSPRDIGDTDEDGALEFLDGWGNPINYIRWPVGFVAYSDLMSGDADSDHDPFDPFRRDMPTAISPRVRDYPSSIKDFMDEIRDRNSQKNPVSAYRLLPLVYSGGPDGDPDLFLAKQTLIDDPYRVYESSGITAQIGTPMASNPSGINIDPDDDGDNWLDNIHSHLLDGR